MVCTSPITLKKYPNLKFRCRKCLSCLITKRQEWAIRCYYESLEYSHNSFLTLTIDDFHMKKRGSIYVNSEDIRLFIKRLRKKLYPVRVKYVAVGEYGEKTSRAHYHILLFGYDFPDKKYHTLTKKGNLSYTSDTLKSLWTMGHSFIANVEHASASYVAGYTHKKLITDTVDYDTGEVGKKPFITCSHGIGRRFAEKHIDQLYNHDYLYYFDKNQKGKYQALPEFFNKILKENFSERDIDLLKVRRKENIPEMDEERLKVRDYILHKKFTER